MAAVAKVLFLGVALAALPALAASGLTGADFETVEKAMRAELEKQPGRAVTSVTFSNITEMQAKARVITIGPLESVEWICTIEATSTGARWHCTR